MILPIGLTDQKDQKMATTDARQFRLTISAILESYGIDNLALESKLVESARIFFEETKKGKEPVQTRKDIVDALLEDAGKYAAYERMNERIEVALRLHPDGGDKWNKVTNYCLSHPEQTIEQYAEWLANDPFNSPKAHQIAMNPEIIIATWPQAFKNKPILATIAKDERGLPESY